MKNKGFGFYCVIVSAILAAVALGMYGGAMSKNPVVYTWLGVALAVDVVAVIAAVAVKKGEWINWLPVIAAALTMWGLMQSVDVMLDACGYVVAGLYVFADIQGWVIFMAVALVAWLVSVIGCFAKVIK